MSHMKLPQFANWNLMAFIKTLADGDQTVTLTCTYRHDVESRYWWTLEWICPYNLRKETASASRIDLLVERAAEIHQNAEDNYNREQTERLKHMSTVYIDPPFGTKQGK